jgi:hypothetical protein
MVSVFVGAGGLAAAGKPTLVHYGNKEKPNAETMGGDWGD